MMTLVDPPPKRARDIELEPALTWTVPYDQWGAYTQGRRIDISLELERMATGLKMASGGAELDGRKLSFIVVVIEAKRDRSEASSIESIVVCRPPSPPAATTARITPEGILLDWKPGEAEGSAPSSTGGRFGIYRQAAGDPRPDTAVATVSTGAAWLDKDAIIGREYRYVIREGGAAAGHCESSDSPPITATRVDLFPPAPPEGLAAVAEHGAIRLFWRPGKDSDLRGYRVYRADGADKAWRLITPEDLTSTSYTDEDVIPGVVYSYAVTARDGADPVNESAWSDPAVETLKPSKESRKP